MYEDSWYSFVPEAQHQHQHKRGASVSHAHRRKDSLLQQPNEPGQNAKVEPLEDLFEEEADGSPPEPTLARRAKSYSDFYDVVKAQLYKDESKRRKAKRKPKRRELCSIEALDVVESYAPLALEEDPILSLYQDELLAASHQKYTLYHDQLAMTERHLETLLEDTDGALKLLASLSESFDAVEEQTTSFKAQCDDLITDQERLQTLAEEVGTDLQYYAYLENATRRLNAPGASRLVDDDAFGDILDSLDSCIAFMTKHSTYRDADQYLARYQALMAKALHLLDTGFTARLDKVSADIGPKIAATQSESARHALAYGRFEELISESYSLLPNVRKVVSNAYDHLGNARQDPNVDVYSNTVKSLFQSYMSVRDKDLRPMIQKDLDAFKGEAKGAAVEPAARNLMKQCFERSYTEVGLFAKIFAVEPQYNSDPSSVYTVLKSNHRSLVNPVNIVPIATNLQATLPPTDLPALCNVIGWAMNEYLAPDYDEDETGFARHCRELTARLLTEHLWAYADAAFEAEIARSISKAPLTPESLTIGPVTNGIASSNAYPPVKRALELLILFDQCMPKERCQRSSPIIFKILRESIGSLHRAESRIRASRNGTDPDLFLIKNLLILKNELVSLEITSVGPGGQHHPSHSAAAAAAAAAGGMQHFSAIWDSTLSTSSSAVFGFLSGLTSYIPWRGGGPSPAQSPSAGTTPTPNHHSNSQSPTPGVRPAAAAAAAAEEKDASEQLDDLLRKAIYAFTHRWGQAVADARAGKPGAKAPAHRVEKELEEVLDRAFAGQPEVVAKLKEAVGASAAAVAEGAKGGEGGTGRKGRGGR